MKKILLYASVFIATSCYAQLPVLVKDINTGNDSTKYPHQLTAFGSKVVFVQNDGTTDKLWISDGTDHGTIALTEAANPNVKSIFKDRLYFIAADKDHGLEMWSTDGTPSGTMMLKDINPGQDGSGPIEHSFVIGDQLFFTANDGSHGEEWWVTNGSESGTHLVRDNFQGKDQNVVLNDTRRTVLNYNDKMVYFASGGTFDTLQLWITDGTEGGTQMLTSGSRMRPLDAITMCDYIIFKDKIYFTYKGAKSTELWVSDGTPAGTGIFKDIVPEKSGYNASASPDRFSIYNNELYFMAFDENNKRSLWKTDGTAEGTEKIIVLQDIASANSFTVFNNKLYFSAATPGGNLSLWETNGTAAGTHVVKEVEVDSYGPNGTAMKTFLEYDNKMYFVGYEKEYGSELWQTDGTPEGTIRITDVVTGKDGS
jgi:ELWxxDGT repeat protein